MKRILTFAVIAVAIGLIGRIMLNADAKSTQAQALAIQPAVATVTQIPTNTPVPSATIGYQDTAVVAQQTAMEAVRVNAMITAEFEQRAQEQLQLTAAAEYQYFVVLGWTATAAGTSVPLTSTQQAIYNNQLTTQQAIDAGKLTATAQAPTMVVAMARAEVEAGISRSTAKVELVGGVVWKIVFPVISLLIVVLVLVLLLKPEKQVVEEPEEEVEIVVPEGLTPLTREKYIVPCRPDQLSEMWELVINGERSFSIPRMQESTRTLRNRSMLGKIRKWMRLNEFVTELPHDEIAIKDSMIAFLEQWQTDGELPEGYTFALSPTE